VSVEARRGTAGVLLFLIHAYIRALADGAQFQSDDE
jgi:hypothetical protein